MQITIVSNQKKPTATTPVVAYFKGGKPQSSAGWKKLGRARSLVTTHFKSGFAGQPTKHGAFVGGRDRGVIVVGLGEKKSWQQHQLVLIARQVIAIAKHHRLSRLALWLEDWRVSGQADEATVETIATQTVLAEYDFNRYKKAPPDGWPTITKLEIIVPANKIQAARRAVSAGVILGEESNHTRDLANTPGGEMTPRVLADEARKIATKLRLEIEVLRPAQMKRISLGGILGVARGSTEEPRFIILTYRGGKKSERPFVLVGKGVTFDTGGLNLKLEDSMYEMHLDMSGGAAVLHATAAAARLKLPVNIVTIVPAVENMPSGSGYRPGDLLKSLSGKTIEVLNTDAEGRIILADALTYAERFKPQLVVDLATLTGAAEVALGVWASALFTREEKWEQLFRQSGDRTGDYVWPLPLWDEYEAEVKGTFGDVANIGKFKGKGGAITAAMFLYQFAKKYPWVHLDIAPTMRSNEGQHLAKGATGAGLRVVVEVLRRLSEKKL